jgi:hypothetical protein
MCAIFFNNIGLTFVLGIPTCLLGFPVLVQASIVDVLESVQPHEGKIRGRE